MRAVCRLSLVRFLSLRRKLKQTSCDVTTDIFSPMSRFFAIPLALALLLVDVCAGGSCCGPCCPLGPPVRPVPGVVRVTNAVGSALHMGSGVVVANFADRDVVLTCNHLFGEGVGRITVYVAGGRPFEANLLRRDRAADLAVLEIATSGTKAISLAEANPRPGQTLTACGFGRGDYRSARGGLVRYVGGEGGTPTFELSGPARSGDSGGPILDERGRLVGLLWGTDGRVTVATAVSAIGPFLRPTLDAIAAKENKPRDLVPVRPRRPRVEPEEEPLAEPETDVAEEPGSEDIQNVLTPNRPDAFPSIPLPSPEWPTIPIAAASSRLWDLLAWTGVLLGGTSPVSLLLLYYLRHRRLRAAANATTPAVTQYGRLNDKYASQLADLYALSGRSPTADATLGREYDRELENAETGSDPVIAKWARQLRRRVASRFYRIHDETPVPAEPV